jgi:hypothetical protein
MIDRTTRRLSIPVIEKKKIRRELRIKSQQSTICGSGKIIYCGGNVRKKFKKL